MATELNHFKVIDYGIFALYLASTVAVGVIFTQKKGSLKSYLLADRNMNFALVGISVLAAFFSGISYLAYPGEIYGNGIGFFIVGFCYFIATPLTSIIFLPFFCHSRFYTAYQYFDERFGVQVRLLASFLFMVQVLVRLALATYAPALALQQVTGLPIWFTILCTGVLTTTYTTLGGMKAVIWTDVIQFLVLMGGQLLILLVGMSQLPHGFSTMYQIAHDNGKLTLDFSLDPHIRMTVWAALIGGTSLALVQMATDQIAVQRYLTASSLKEARRALWLKLWLLFPVLVIFCLTGLVLFAFYHLHGDPLATGQISKIDQILPYFVATQLPAGVPGLLVAAIYGATMAAVSSGINSLTSTSVVDFYERLWKGAKLNTERTRMRLARILTIFYGLLVMFIAFEAHRFGTLVESTNKVIGLMGGPLLGMFILGMFSKRTNLNGVMAGWLAGVVVGLYVCFATSISFLWYALAGFIATIVVGWSVSWLFPPPASQNLQSLTWGSRYEEQKQSPLANPQELGRAE